MIIIGYSAPKKYGVLLFDMFGGPIQDRQRCANTLKDAAKIAREDMAPHPFSSAAIYTLKNNAANAVRYIKCTDR